VTRATIVPPSVLPRIVSTLQGKLLGIVGFTMLGLWTALARAGGANGVHDSAADTATLANVVVQATKLNKQALKHAVHEFAASHERLNPRSAQISHWVIPICPLTRGLDRRYDEYVNRRILSIAHEVGAPSSTAKSCKANVWILFTRDPQAQVNLFARKWPTMLGWVSGSLKRLATVRFPIQAWYVTGTASPLGGIAGLDAANGPSFIVNNEGFDGSRLRDVVSEIGFVLVVVNAEKVARYSLTTISDYVAMVVLTRTALNGCSVLPSIIDLLSPDCGPRERPILLTDADKAFLKAMYGTRFGVRVNVERGQINENFVRILSR